MKKIFMFAAMTAFIGMYSTSYAQDEKKETRTEKKCDKKSKKCCKKGEKKCCKKKEEDDK